MAEQSESAQTLDRGLHILELLSEQPRGLTTTEIADLLGIHRSSAHRLLGPLLAHHLILRRRDKRYELAVGLTRIAAGVHQELRTVGQRALTELSEAHGATAELAVARGDEVVTLIVVEPLHARVHVSFRAGLSHPIHDGSSGIAILSGRPARATDSPEVIRARKRGYAISTGEVFREITGVHAPVLVPSRLIEASIGLSLLSESSAEAVAHQVKVAAQRLVKDLGG